MLNNAFKFNLLKYLIFTIYVALMFVMGCNTKNDEKILQIDLSQKDEKSELQKGITDTTKLFVAVSTMISPLETFSLYQDLINYISKKINVQIVFKQRKTYEEVNKLLEEKKLDFAFICTGAYLQARKEFPIELLAIPVVEGRPYYNAYVIVNKESKIKSFDELKNKSFAYTDPLSNTGYMYIINLLKEKNQGDKYFSKTIFTYAHDYSIQAVSRNLVDGASVDGLVYEYLKYFQPEKVKNISIINKSSDFGIPPFVVQPEMDRVIKEKIKQVMYDMHKDEEGKIILGKILIDKFIPANDSLYHQ